MTAGPTPAPRTAAGRALLTSILAVFGAAKVDVWKDAHVLRDAILAIEAEAVAPSGLRADDLDGQGMAFRAFGDAIGEIGLRQIEEPLTEDDIRAVALLARGVLRWCVPRAAAPEGLRETLPAQLRAIADRLEAADAEKAAALDELGGGIKCPACDRTFKDNRGFPAHARTHRQATNGGGSNAWKAEPVMRHGKETFLCNRCPQTFETREKLKGHMMRGHPPTVAATRPFGERSLIEPSGGGLP